MGSYATLYLGRYELASTKTFIDPTIMMLFTERDKRVRMPDAGEVTIAQDGTEVDATPVVEYVASLGVVRDRLEVLGYTLARVQEEFQHAVKARISETIADIEYAETHNAAWMLPRLDSLNILSVLTFDKWLDATGIIFRGNHIPGLPPREGGSDVELPPIAQYLLDDRGGETWTPFNDFRSYMRAAIEVAGVAEEIVYDVSDLAANEYIDVSVDLCDAARRDLADEFVVNHKVIILTEGKCDKWSIEGALHLLYPHLAGFYAFMDFELARVEGGAGALVAVIKAFIGAGIVNRTIALFDNDSAARAALRGLRDVKLPANVRVVHLPDVEWARKYPTLGPQSMLEMDVNGSAGSVELYFGSDVLRQNDGTLMPVQWRGYEMALSQYQGEVLNKATLQERYADKLTACRKNSGAIEGYDWTGMRAIIDVIRTAFHDVAYDP